ncbi:MAG: acetylxylan esterase [Mariniblastus sp.]|nr:acetylxylan esterase [Mariniblastus sp.]
MQKVLLALLAPLVFLPGPWTQTLRTQTLRTQTLRTQTRSEQTTTTQSTDPRTETPRTLNGYFPFEPPESQAEWNARAERMRSQLKMSLGLVPEPTRTPLNPVVHTPIDMGEYTVEHVYFESVPGFFVTGNLYKPKQGRALAPGILCPHGHHRDGRFLKASPAEIDAQIKKGGEQFRNNAQSPLQARCAHLAKMGCIVFHYDMLGYADSQQIPYQLAHRFTKQREHMNEQSGWGLFSPRAESNLQNVMGLQTWNSIRALDFLESLPGVDAQRIGVTGASGGGTQTFILCAIDPRPAVAFPAVMVSTAMQGGCTCENCSYLRINGGNVDFAALFAPKPLGLTAADDWTREMEVRGFPELKKLYSLLGKPENVALTARIEFEHNYNQVSREAMYRWFARHLRLSGPVVEKEIQFIDREQLSVFDDKHPRPQGGEEFEIKLLGRLHQDAFTKLNPAQTDPTKNASRRKSVEQFLDTAVGDVGPGSPRNYKVEKLFKPSKSEGIKRVPFQLMNQLGEQTEGIFYSAQRPTKACVLWLGIPAEFSEIDPPSKELFKRLLDEGYGIYTIDHTFLTDSTTADSTTAKWVTNHRDFAGYTYGYNPPQVVQKTHDILGLLRTEGLPSERPSVLMAFSLADVPAAALAIACSENELESVVIDTHGFRFENIEEIESIHLLPGATKFGDLPGLLSHPIGLNSLFFSEPAVAHWTDQSPPKFSPPGTKPLTQTGIRSILRWLNCPASQ